MSFIVYVSEPRKRSRNSFEFQSTSKSGVNPAHNCTQNRNSNFADLSRLPGRTVVRHADLNSPAALATAEGGAPKTLHSQRSRTCWHTRTNLLGGQSARACGSSRAGRCQ